MFSGLLEREDACLMGDHGDLPGFLDRRSGSAVVSEDRQVWLMVARLWDSAWPGLAD